MSATNRGAATGYEREPDDFFETPSWVTKVILPHLALHTMKGRILEPTCGRGAILRELVSFGFDGTIDAVELDHDRARAASTVVPKVRCTDFLAWAKEQPDDTPEISLSISNPPFGIAMEVVEASLALVDPEVGQVAMLLRLNWLSSMKRVAFHRAHPADIFVLPRRPSFCLSINCKAKACGWHVTLPVDAERPSGCAKCGLQVRVSTTDSIEYAWFLWGHGRGNRWFLLDPPEADEDPSIAPRSRKKKPAHAPPPVLA